MQPAFGRWPIGNRPRDGTLPHADGLTERNPLALPGVVVRLVLAGLAESLSPGMRAVRVDANTALRQE